MKNIIILATIFALLLLSSCTTSRNRSAGSLSNAMEKSSDDYEGERKIDAVIIEEEPDEDKNEYTYDHNSHITFEPGKKKNSNSEITLGKDHWLGFQFGTGILSTDSFYGLSSFALTGNQYTGGKRSLSYELGFDYAPLQTTATAEFDPLEDDIVQGLEGGI
ncbi:MAG: hypothetical protein KAH33_04720, partial [Candidatus Delongbacteria bacterium]|nr:hypothetical protein [Candidatus Delongbacteria bacterium]